MVRILHTSDWHVGKTVRGQSRADEHRAVLAEIADIAGAHEVDLVVVAGDLFETAAPTAESEQIVYTGLLALSRLGVPLIVIAGNHDNARRLKAVAPLLELGDITLLTEAARPEDGGVRRITTSSGADVQVALLPFVSQRGIVKAESLMGNAAFENSQMYAERMAALVGVLTAGFSADTVNLIVAHAFVTGGEVGGGERMAHVVDEYRVNASAFPVTAQYVALGHLHRAQKVPGATAIHYSGAPLQIDFGEENQTKHVMLVDAEPGLPAKVTSIPLSSGREMRTITGTLDDLAAQSADVGDEAWLRVVVREPGRAGLADEVRALFGERAVDIRVDAPATARRDPVRSRRDGRSPQDLFAEFLTTREIADPRLDALFAELLDEALGVDIEVSA